jgi:hypothetical protein
VHRKAAEAVVDTPVAAVIPAVAAVTTANNKFFPQSRSRLLTEQTGSAIFLNLIFWLGNLLCATLG